MFVRYRRYNKRFSCPWTLVELLTVRWKFFPITLFLFYFRSWQTWPHQSISDSQQLQTSSKVLTVSLSVLSKPYLWSPLNVYIYWLYLGFIVWERGPEWPKATSFLGWSGGIPPQKFFWNQYVQRCNLVHFWETILRNVTVCTLTSSSLDDFPDMFTCIL